MFQTVKRIIRWCGEFRGKLYLGFVFSFFSTWFAAMPIMAAAYTVGLLLERELIQEAGRLAVPGRPMQFRTTQNFLRSFGLASLDDLPELACTTREDAQIAMEMESALRRLQEAERAGAGVEDGQ